MENNQRNTRKRLNSLILLVAFTAVMLIVSTYAWFSAQKTVTISSLEGDVQVAEGLEISLDASHWGQSIDFKEVIKEGDTQAALADAIHYLDTDTENDGTNPHNIIPAELVPVSTTGASGEGIGLADMKMYRGVNTDIIKLADVAETDKTKTSKTDPLYPGYYAIDLFIRDSSADTGMSTLQLNTSSSLQLTASGDPTTGLQNTVRVGFALYESDTTDELTYTSTQTEIITATMTDSTSKIADVAIWEPNSADHVEYIVTNYGSRITWKTGEAAHYITNTANAALGRFSNGDKLPTYALTSASGAMDDIYKWDGTVTGLAKQITLQTTNSGTSYNIKEGIQNLISVTTDEKLIYPIDPAAEETDTLEKVDFQIPKNQPARVRMFIWLEGQDPDCVNYASHGGTIKLDLGLQKDGIEGSQS